MHPKVASLLHLSTGVADPWLNSFIERKSRGNPEFSLNIDASSPPDAGRLMEKKTSRLFPFHISGCIKKQTAMVGKLK